MTSTLRPPAPPAAPWVEALLLPSLASLYVPLAVAANMPRELVRLQDFGRPVGITLIASATGWALGYGVRRTRETAALAAVIVAMSYSSLGVVVRTMGYLRGGADIAHLGGLVLLCAVAIGGLLVALLGTRHPLGGIVRYLTVCAILLVTWNAGKLMWGQLRAEPMAPSVAADIAAPAGVPEPAPDIFLIVVDKYTGSRILDSALRFDNRPFEQALRSRGFIVPSDARANYVHTFLALAAMLNLRYLDDLTVRYGASSRWDSAYPLIENNRLAAFLRARRYRVITLPSAFAGTRQNRYADRQVPAPRDVRSEIYARWVRNTAGPSLQMLACALAGCEANVPPYVPATADVLDLQFRSLATLPPDGTRPLFVFAHLLTPHEPYVYGPDCRHRPPFWPMRDSDDVERVRLAYLEQIQCVNTKLLEVVDSIRARSRVPPVILIQADHGHARLGRDIPALATVSQEAIRERRSVFAAYLLPGVPADSVSPTITPVNVTRLVLRHYFRADVPALADATFWSSAWEPYRFEAVP